MKSLKAVSTVATTYGCSDSDEESDGSDFEDSDEESEPTPSICHSTIPANSDDDSDDELPEQMSDQPSPLFFFYDCEATGGSIYKDHIVEIAAVVQPPENVEVRLPTTFQSLVNTSRRIAAPGNYNVQQIFLLHSLLVFCEYFSLNNCSAILSLKIFSCEEVWHQANRPPESTKTVPGASQVFFLGKKPNK